MPRNASQTSSGTTSSDVNPMSVVNISGAGRFSFLPDGTLMLDATGNWLLCQRAIDTPVHEMLLNSGHIIANLGSTAGAPVVIQDRTGPHEQPLQRPGGSEPGDGARGASRHR
jgi:hypothetical protein